MFDPMSWTMASLAVLVAGLLRELIRLVVFIWGLAIALRGTRGAVRVRVIDAYGRSARPSSGRAGRPR